MKRKYIHIISALCAALMASFATSCSSSRKAQKAQEEEPALENMEVSDTVSVKDSAEFVKPVRDEEHRVRLLYGVRNAEFKKLEE